MSNYFNTPDFSNFGVMANSIGPIPEAFLVKKVAEQNTFYNLFNNEYKYNPHNNNCYDYNSPLWDEEDEDYDEYENEEDNW